MKSTRVLIVSLHYRPEPNFVVSDIAERLQREGYDVTVVTTFPNYPLGRFYDGVDSIWPKSELVNGVRVIRVPSLPNRSLSIVKRGLSYLFFTLMAALVAPFICFRPRMVIVYQTPFFTALAALFFKAIYQSKLIYIYADLWPESLVAAKIGAKQWFLKILYWYSAWINRFCDALVSSTPGMTARYLKDGVAPEKISYIPVWVDASCGALSMPEVPLQEQGIRIVYAGNFGPAQGLESVIEAAALLQKRGSKVEFVFYGSGPSEQALKGRVEERALSNVKFCGRVSSDEVRRVCARATAQLVHLVDSPQFLFTIPSKLLFSLAVGRPILGGLAGDAARILEESSAGIVFPPSDPEALADAVLRLEEMTAAECVEMGEKGRRYFAEHYHPEVLLRRYLEITAKYLQK